MSQTGVGILDYSSKFESIIFILKPFDRSSINLSNHRKFYFKLLISYYLHVKIITENRSQVTGICKWRDPASEHQKMIIQLNISPILDQVSAILRRINQKIYLILILASQSQVEKLIT